MYKLIKNPQGQTATVLRLSDNAFIPMDEQNTDYQAFLRWCEEGNQPEAADEIKGE